jgi:hypothetical protein
LPGGEEEAARDAGEDEEVVEEGSGRGRRRRPACEGRKKRGFLMCKGHFAKRSSVKYVIFYCFTVSWTFYENPLQHKSILRKLYRDPVIPNLLEGSTKP